MSVEIFGESIKSAISIKLGEIFPDITRYKESVTTLKYPHFFISQLNLEVAEQEKNRYLLNYLINIRYRYVSDVETVSNIQQQLDEVGLKLLSDFDFINVPDKNGNKSRPTKIINARYEKSDGVLQFFCNISLRAKKEELEITPMEKLKLQEEVK